MNLVFRRYYEDKRGLLMVLLLVALGNVGFYLLLSGPAQLRTAALRNELDGAERDVKVALRGYGRALLEAKLLDTAQVRMEALYRETFQAPSERLAKVDAKVRELASKSQLELHAMAYGYSWLIPERLEKLTLTFNLKGSYERLRRFVASVEGAEGEDGRDLFFSIEQVSLSDSTEAGSELNLSTTVATYFYKPELAEQDSHARGPKRKEPRR